MGSVLFETAATAAATAAGETGTGLDQMTRFMSAFMVIIGVFALYSAITGKGPAYKNDYPKVMQADANKLLRKFLWIIGPVLTVFGVLEYMGFEWATWVNMAVSLSAIVVYMVIFRKRFGKYLK